MIALKSYRFKKAISLFVVVSILLMTVFPTMIFNTSAVHTLGDSVEKVVYDFDSHAFSDGIAQNTSSLAIDSTGSTYSFSNTAVFSLSGHNVANSGFFNVVGLPSGKSRSYSTDGTAANAYKYANETAYPNLNASEHKNVLRIGLNAYNSSSTAKRAVALNNGAEALTLPAGNYVIQFDYYATSAAATEGVTFSVIKNISESINSAGKYVTGGRCSNLHTVFNTASDDSIFGTWQTVSYPISLTEEATTIGFTIEKLTSSTEVFIDNIVISSKTIVRFEAGDADVAPISAAVGSTVNLPDANDVVLAGKLFDGWYYDSSFTSKVEATTGFVLPTDKYELTLYAKFKDVNDTSVAKYSFDDGEKVNEQVEGIKVSGSTFSKLDVSELGGTGYALAVAPNRTLYNGGSRSFAFNDGAAWLTVTPGTYTITYKYLVTNRDANGTGNNAFTNYSSIVNNVADVCLVYNIPKTNNMSSLGQQGTKLASLCDFDPAKDDGWRSGEIVITIPGTENVTLGIMAQYVLFDVYIDDIVITPSTTKNVTVSFDTMGGSEVPSMTGEVGEAFTVEAPIRENYIFAGWYKNNAYTEKAELIYPDENATFYARWISSVTLFDFDNDNFKANTTIADGIVSGGIFSIVDASAFSENGKALAVTPDRIQYTGYDRSLKFNNGINFYTVEAGQLIDITYSYYITNRHGDEGVTGYSNYSDSWKTVNGSGIHFIEGVTGDTAANINGTAIRDVNGKLVKFVDIDNDAVNTWHTKTVRLLTTKEGVLGIKASYVWADIYFDNITIAQVKAEEKTISFETNGGEAVSSITGIVGSNVTLPTTSLAGKQFAGWYLDEALTNPAPNVVPAQDTVYYAKWLSEGEFVLNFENGFLTGNANQYGSSLFGIENNFDSQHANVLRYGGATSDIGRAHKLSNNNVLCKVIPNTTYMVKFDYYVETLPVSGTFVTDFVTNFGQVAYNQHTRLTDRNLTPEIRAENTDIVGKWITKTLFISTPAQLRNTDVGIYTNIGKGATVYFDNISFTKFVADKPYLVIDYGTEYDGMTETREGMLGERIILPALSSGENQFIGWYSDSAYTKPFTAKQFTENGIVYAYACWYTASKHTVTFDDMPDAFQSNTAGSYYTASCFSIANSKGINGSKALHIQKPTGALKYTVLNNGNTNFMVEANTTYKITIRHYIEKTGGAASISFVTAHSKNYFVNNVKHGSSFSLQNTKGKWIETVAVVTFSNSGSVFIGIEGASGAELYIDNIEFESCSPLDKIITFSAPEIGFTKQIIGESGTVIDPSLIPVVNNKQYSFGGWFIDEECTEPYKGRVFPANNITVYAKLIKSKTTTVDFTDYPWIGDTSNLKISASVMSITSDGLSSDGDGFALFFDNTKKETQTTASKKILLGANSAVKLQPGTRYYITYDYYLLDNESPTGVTQISAAVCSGNNMWTNNTEFTSLHTSVVSLTPKNKWLTGAFVGKTPEDVSDQSLTLAISLPLNVQMYIDNIRITQLDENEVTVTYLSTKDGVIKNNTYTMGEKISIAGAIKADAGFKFAGWLFGSELYKAGEKLTVEQDVIFNANFTFERFFEGFEDVDYDIYTLGEYGIDADYEIYDSKLGDNTSDNVKSGRYSLHRIGKEPGFKAYSVHLNSNVRDKTLNFTTSYTISMWVKIENPIHKLGAIEIGCNTTYRVPWNIEGDRMAIASIAEVADGQWHEITFSFTAVTNYISIFLPGNLSIYIDDITIVPNDEFKINRMVTYEPYIPAFLNEDGKYEFDSNNDPFYLAPYEIVKRADSQSDVSSNSVGYTLVLVAVGIGVALLVIISVVIIIVLAKKRKGGKGNA